MNGLLSFGLRELTVNLQANIRTVIFLNIGELELPKQLLTVILRF